MEMEGLADQGRPYVVQEIDSAWVAVSSFHASLDILFIYKHHNIMEPQDKDYLVMVDRGHDQNTPGKRSPDGTFLEWKFNRDLGDRVIRELQSQGIPVVIVNEGDGYLSLRDRWKKAGELAGKFDGKSMLISIHANAAGDGKRWARARGWQIHVHPQASASSKELASCLAEAAKNEGLKVRRPLPAQLYWEDRFAILSPSPLFSAVLVENLFYDNKDDLAILQSEEGKERLARVIVEGIKYYIEKRP